MMSTIKIAGASAFWGDSFTAVPQLLEADIDYLTFDYLAEVTMAILARARSKSPDLGYATDFVTEAMGPNLGRISKKGIKVLSNAGGENPAACAQALQKLIEEQGLKLKVAYVVGDDLLPRDAEFRQNRVKEMFSDAEFPPHLLSANAYCGAFPIARALNEGADIVVTGRVVDSALALGAAIHAFGWTVDEFDKLSGGSLAGHIIECGAQACGGIYTDWQDVPRWEDISYPIVELSPDGSFTVAKPEGTGGIITVGTVAEQLVYEIGDPRNYLLPDVICNFADVKIEQIEKDVVRVSNIKGRQPSASVKVSATWQDGFRLGFYTTIVGIDAGAKAERMARAVFARCTTMFEERGFGPFAETSSEVMGAEASYGAFRQDFKPREVVLKLAAKHPNRKALELFLREATSGGTSWAVGTSGLQGHRPKPMPQIRLFSFLAGKDTVVPRVIMDNEAFDCPFQQLDRLQPAADEQDPAGEIALPIMPDADPDWSEVPLISLAWGRSGDKGDKANIGIIARKEEYLPYIAASITPEVVAERFAHFLGGEPVDRYFLPGLSALNFVLHDALGGGGTASLRNDSQAKTFAQILLDAPVRVSAEILAQLELP